MIKINGRVASYKNINIFFTYCFRFVLYLGLFSLIYQATKQAFYIIRYLRRRLPKCRVGVIPERYNAGIGDLLEKEIFQLERLRFRIYPGPNSIAAQSVHGHDAEARMWSVKWTRSQ